MSEIDAALDAVGWPAEARSVFSGEVKLEETVYTPDAEEDVE